jgi:outer membrane protein, heavy metal efflux system
MDWFISLPSQRDVGWPWLDRTQFLALALAIPLFIAPAARADQPGATADSVLAIARQLSPQLAARALDTEAARARVSVAGSLPDPTLRITSDDIDRLSGPRQNKMIYSVEQEIPLWGKRELRQQAAEAEVSQKAAELRGADVELAERVKIAFALYYQSWQTLRTTREMRPILAGIAQTARDRYAHSLASQQEVIRTELETTRLANDILRAEGVLRSAQGRLNALLLRPLPAPLAPPQMLRPLPPPGRLDVAALVDRTRVGNPSLAADDAMIRASDRNAALARRDWYPDVTLSVGAIDRRGNGPNGYAASISAKLPLQWGLHEGKVRDAAAQANAARARQDVTHQQIALDLAEATSALEASRATADLTRRRMIPQAQAMLRSATTDYAVGKAELASVLQAARELVVIRIELLATELDQQRQLAAIERLIGGDL